MKSILKRLQHPNIKIVVFSESVILNDPIEEWPICDCLIAFFSVGFPLDKAVKYAKLRKPLLINDLESQYDLLDRCVCACARMYVWMLPTSLWLGNTPLSLTLNKKSKSVAWGIPESYLLACGTKEGIFDLEEVYH